MFKVISVASQKGGVGKTTTSSTLAAGLKIKGYHTLCIDMDQQCNLSYSANAEFSKGNIYDVLQDKIKISESIQCLPCFDLICGTPLLAGADAKITDTGKEYRLSEAILELSDKYDFIILDTPPSLGILTVNALTASTNVVIPTQADIYSLQGIEQLMKTIAAVKKYCNPKLHVDGILFTRFNPRSILSKDVSQLARRLADGIGAVLYDTTIRDAVAVREAQISKKTLFEYDMKAKVTNDYISFVDEYLAKMKEV